MKGWNGYIPMVKVIEIFPGGEVSVRDWNGHSSTVSLNPHLMREEIKPGDYVTVHCGFITEKADFSSGRPQYFRRRFSF